VASQLVEGTHQENDVILRGLRFRPLDRHNRRDALAIRWGVGGDPDPLVMPNTCRRYGARVGF